MSTFQHVSKHEQVPLDFWPTGEKEILPILPILAKFRGTAAIWEPCCGNGAISEILKADRHTVFSTDIENYGYADQMAKTDFMACDSLPAPSVRAIVTNPPYGNMPPKIIRHALDLMKPVGGTVLMLLRHNWDSGSTRQDLYKWPHVAKHTMLWRPYWTEERTATPMHNYAWFEWDFSSSVLAPVNKYISE